MEADTGQVKCPICDASFVRREIEKHVDSCLSNSQKEKPSTRSASKPSPPNGFFQRKPKRKMSTIPEKFYHTKKQKEETEIKSLPNTDQSTLNSTNTDQSTLNNNENSIIKVENSEEMKLEGDIYKNIPSENITHTQKLQLEMSQSPKNGFAETLLKWSKNKNTIEASKYTEVDKERIPQVNLSNDFEMVGKKNHVFQSNVNLKSKIFIKTESAQQRNTKKNNIVLGKAPLADQMRPCSFDQYFGQEAVNSKNKILKDLFNSLNIPSLILWGPPGCGKTSLAHIISQSCRSSLKYRFVSLSATMSNVSEVKEVMKVAKNERQLTKRQTILFIDEIHRFNKLQQDSFLPHVESGLFILIGATTENPSFHVNNALLSRCKLVVLTQLDVEAIVNILKRTIMCLNGVEQNGEVKREQNVDQENIRFVLEEGVLKSIAQYAHGDARSALNTLDLILQANLITSNEPLEEPCFITMDQVKEEAKRGYVNYDRHGDDHYDIISALHKSIRGGDENAGLYWLARMLEGGETPLYIARRLVRIASEDIGLADPNSLTQAVSAYQACHWLGMPECDVILAQAVTYLARAPKSIEVYEAYNEAKRVVKDWSGTQPTVPLHLRNAPTRMMKDLGYGSGYKYTPKCTDDASQEYLPTELKGRIFFNDT